MNRKLYLTGLIICLLGLAGCSSQSQNITAESYMSMQLESKAHKGLIKSLGGAYNSYGATHILTLDDGSNLYLIFSKSMASAADAYLNTYVEVRGKETDVSGQKVLEVINIDIAKKEFGAKSVIKEAVKTLEFQAVKVGLKFKYKNSYQVKSLANGVELNLFKRDDEAISENEASTEVNSQDLLATVSIMSISEDDLKKLIGILPTDKTTDTELKKRSLNKEIIGGKSWVSFRKDVSKKEMFYVFANGEIWIKIDYKVMNEADFATYRNDFYEILNSLNVI